MGFTVAQTYLSDILHVVAQSLLAPDIILLLGFILYALFCIGSVVAEYFTERRHFKVVMPRFLAALMASKEEDIPEVIEHSGLLKRQKDALSTVYEYRALPGDALVALVRRLVSEEETRYDRITGRNNMAAKVTPMLGLMGTLIPLGPGIQALGTADTAALSSSLLVAFDTTVAGLVTAAICLVVGKIRSNWYNNYLSALDAAMATMMEKIEEGRETSTATLPEGADSYKFLYDVVDEPKEEEKASEDEAKAKESAKTEEPADVEESADKPEDHESDEPAEVDAAPEAAEDETAPLAAPVEEASALGAAPAIQVVAMDDVFGLGGKPEASDEVPAEAEATEPLASIEPVAEAAEVETPAADEPEAEAPAVEEAEAPVAEEAQAPAADEPEASAEPSKESTPFEPEKSASHFGFVFGTNRGAGENDKPSQTI